MSLAFAADSAKAKSPTKPQPLTPREAKAQIEREIAYRERVVKKETDELERLYREQRALDPDARLKELEESATKLAADSMKSALEQAKDGPINTPQEAKDSIDRAKDRVDQFKEMMDAQGAVIDEVYRQDEMPSEISKQEKTVKQANYEL